MGAAASGLFLTAPVHTVRTGGRGRCLQGKAERPCWHSELEAGCSGSGAVRRGRTRRSGRLGRGLAASCGFGLSCRHWGQGRGQQTRGLGGCPGCRGRWGARARSRWATMVAPMGTEGAGTVLGRERGSWCPGGRLTGRACWWLRASEPGTKRGGSCWRARPGRGQRKLPGAEGARVCHGTRQCSSPGPPALVTH